MTAAAVEDIQVPEGHGLMSTLGKTGDVRHTWDKNSEDEAAAARTLFEDLTGKGYLAYKAKGRRGTQGELIREFDPAAERIILVRPPVGG